MSAAIKNADRRPVAVCIFILLAPERTALSRRGVTQPIGLFLQNFAEWVQGETLPSERVC